MERITHIINDWDPIGFFPLAPQNEYMNEINKISEFVCSNHNLQVQPLAQEINKIFVETFGPDVYSEDLEQCAEIAKQILMLRGTKFFWLLEGELWSPLTKHYIIKYSQ